MSQDTIHGEFEFNVTGSGLKDLQALTRELTRVNEKMLAITKTATKFDSSIRASASSAKSQAKDFDTLAAAVEKVATAESKIGKTSKKSSATSATLGSTNIPSAVRSDQGRELVALMALEKQRAKEWGKDVTNAVRMEKQLASERIRSTRQAAAEERRLAKERASQRTLGTTGILDATRTTQGRELTNLTKIQRQNAKEQAAFASQAIQDQQKQLDGLANTRYALYDVRRTWLLVGAAATAALVVPITKMAQFEAQFASVSRTVGLMGNEVGDMREEFARLTTEIPETFEALAQIGTLAGQLDIPKAALADFTEVVAKFAATTDVGVEEAATNIGRTAQLTKTSAAEYQNLAAAIYQTGVTSVATEGEILRMTTEIATAGNLAGLTNVQIVALSSALASLGVQPERARGSLQRIFNIIENGATVGTKATEGLSRITGYTFEQMQALWKQGDAGSQQVFSAFISGLSGLQKSGENTDTVLKSLGISAVRDIQTLQVLANNTDVYNRSLQETSQAYAEGDALNKGYAQQTDNLQGNLAKLGNTLTAILAELGEAGGWLNTVVKFANDFAKALLTVAESGFGKFVAGMAGGLLALVAAIALSRAVSAGLTAAMYGMVTAAEGVAASGVKTSASLGGLAVQLWKTSAAFVTGSLSGQKFGEILDGTRIKADANASAMQRMKAGFGVAATGAVGLGRALKGLMTSTVILAALSAAVWGASAAWEHFTETAQDRADARFGSGVVELTEALQADKKAIDEGAEAIRYWRGEVKEAGQSVVPEWADQIRDASDAQVTAKVGVETTTESIRNQTIAIGENTAAWLAQQVANDEGLQKIWQQYGSAIGQSGLTEFFDHLKADADSGLAFVEGRTREYNAKMIVLSQELYEARGRGDQAEIAAADQELKLMTARYNGWMKLIPIVQDANTKFAEATSQDQIYAAAAGVAKAVQEELNDEFESGATKADELAKALSVLNSSLQAPHDVADAWRDLGKSIAENGNLFEGLSEAAGENTDALIGLVNSLQKQAGDDLEAFGADILGVMGALQSSGVQSGEIMEYLSAVLNETLGPTYSLDFDTGPFRKNIIEAINLAIQAQQTILATQAAAANAVLESYSGNALGAAAAYDRAMSQQNATQAEIVRLEKLKQIAMQNSDSAQKSLTRSVTAGTNALKKNSSATKKNAKDVKEAARSYRDWANDLREVMKIADEYRFSVEDAWAGVEQAQEDAEEAIIRSIYNIGAAYDALFQEQNHRDELQTLFYSIQDQAESAAKAVRDSANKIAETQAALEGLTSERGQLAYGLRVAEMYGNELRAADLRAKLSAVDVKITKTRDDLTDASKDYQTALDSQSMSLLGNSKQSITNRDAIASLVQQYDKQIEALIETGASQDEVTAAVARSKTEFLNEASALGFAANQLLPYLAVFDRLPASSRAARDAQREATQSVRDLYGAWQTYITALAGSGASMETIRTAINNGKTSVTGLAGELAKGPSQVKNFVDAFDGMKTIVDKVPKNITIPIAADITTTALSEWMKKNTNGKGVYTGSSVGSGLTIPVKVGSAPGTSKAKLKARNDAAKEMQKYADLIMDTKSMSGLTAYSIAWGKAQEKWRATFSTGGFTGRGGKYEEAGVVHRGEYVVPKEQVNQSTGLPYIMEKTVATPKSNNAAAFPATFVVELSPVDRSLMAAAGNVTITLDGKVIANSTNAQNTGTFRRGAN